MPGNCPASLRPTAARLWKTFRSKLNAIPVIGENCSLSPRNRVHLHTGMLFGITTECCSASERNRVHLRPDSPIKHHLRDMYTRLGLRGSEYIPLVKLAVILHEQRAILGIKCQACGEM